ncbi:MAG: AAA family ATPase, partial [Myxococcota bacterium]
MPEIRRARAAATRFRAFFRELKQVFFERDTVVEQIALALLSKEHALLTGPPGTAKSQLSHAVFGRIVCEESGQPSLYSRQITESTVQTDLIGPINFKQLTETGRTEHFTDEGILGAAHAFLDEVFDGRDMLLRTALNVLQERELKQGTKITQGQIEVALMTSNRYIADVLENSRDTLLAFVDRIAFVSFIPRGFADQINLERVLKRHLAGSGGPRLDALLTIQDVDVLQSVVDRVPIAESICTNLAQLLAGLETELAEAVRADPQFVPTRYLSTRTAVRAGRVLRAICVRDWIRKEGERELQVLPEDFKALRLHLMLGGPRLD